MIDDPYPSSNAVPAVMVPTLHAIGQSACLASNETNCAIVSPGGGFGASGPYNGSAGYYNIFQGVQTSGSAITWKGVPIDPPGPSFERILRITNLRGNVKEFGVTSGLVPPQVEALVTIQGDSNPVNPPIFSGYIATVEPGLLTGSGVASPGSYAQCAPPSASVSVTAMEGFAYAFAPQNFEQVLSVGGRGFAPPISGPAYIAPSASDSDQNLPAFGYDTESAFRPDPAIGGATFANPSGIVGLATQGTQLKLTIAGLGSGVHVSVPSYVYLNGPYNQSPPFPGGTPVGVAVLPRHAAPPAYFSTGTGTTGAPGPNVPLIAIDNTASATYEIYYADPFVQETATVPVTVSYLPGLAATGTATLTLSFAPPSTDSSASVLAPVPRFAESEIPQTLFTIGACASAPALA